MKKALILTALFLPLFACSDDSGNSASSDDDGSTTATSTGIFVDGAVINIGYQTATQSGYTNDAGEFSYIEGETVTFNIGDLELPATAAKSTMTPLDIAGVEDVNDTTVVNIIRLLQTLDQDGNPDNGITITESAHNTATTQVNFSLGEVEFAGSDAVTAFISNAGQNTPVTGLVNTADAIAHFESQLQAIGFSSLIAGSYQSQVDGDAFPTEFVLNDDNTGSWSYQEEGGSITWSVSSDGVLTITFDDTGEFEEYTLTSGHASNGTVSINFSNEPTEVASWSKAFSIDMTQHTATSVIIDSDCPNVPGGGIIHLQRLR